MNVNALLCDILTFVPVAVLSIYIGAYLAVKYSFYSRIDRNRESIRRATAKKWTDDYKTFICLIDNVNVKYIRALAKNTKDEDKRFRKLQYCFGLYSFVSFFSGIIINRMGEQTLFHEYILTSATIAYFVLTTVVLVLSYFELKFYQLLEELETQSNKALNRTSESRATRLSESG